MSRQTCFRACRMSGTTRALLDRIPTESPAQRRARTLARRQRSQRGGRDHG